MRISLRNLPMIVCILAVMNASTAMAQVSDFNNANCGNPPATAAGDCSAAIGENSAANGVGAVAIGKGAEANGAASISIGSQAVSNGETSHAIGTRVYANDYFSMAFGRLTVADAQDAIVIGQGTGFYPHLQNSIQSSLMVGFNSNLPTLFVEGSSGAGTWGRVGIGTTAPQGILHVRDESGTATDLIIDRHGSAQANLRFNTGGTGQRARIGLNNSGNHLYYDMLQASADHVFSVNTGTEAMRIVGVSANVGIGTGNPAARMQVYTSAARIARFYYDDTSTDNTRPRLDILGSKNRIDIRTAYGTGGAHLVLSTTAATDAVCLRENGNLGIGTTTPSGRLHVNGTVFVANLPGGSGGVDVGQNPLSSDQLIDLNGSKEVYKQNFTDFEFDRQAFLNLNIKRFDWKEAYGGGADVGMVAEEVDEFFPELAYHGYRRQYLDDGTMVCDSMGVPIQDSSQVEVRGVKYHKLALYLFALVKDQNARISQLENQLDEQGYAIAVCCGSAPAAGYRLDGDDTKPGLINQVEAEYVLLRNDPNPFSDYTDIRYETSDCSRCEIVIMDINGRVVKRIRVNGSSGTVRVYSSEIGQGIYTYALLQGGSVLRTSKLVSTRN